MKLTWKQKTTAVALGLGLVLLGCDESSSSDLILECLEIAPEYHVARWRFDPKVEELRVFGYGASVEGIQTGQVESIPAEYVGVAGGTNDLLTGQGVQNFFGNRTIRVTLTLAMNDGLYNQIVTRTATAICPQQEKNYCSLDNPSGC